MKRALGIAAGLLLLTGAALAEDTKEGWGLQFRQDTFDQSVVPLAMMSESGDGFDKALLAFACGPDGKLTAFFQAERFMMFSNAEKLQLRDGQATKEFVFSSGDVPHLGKRLVAAPGKADEIATIFKSANSADVPFRSEKKQGVFTSIGSVETFEIMSEYCAK